MLQLTKDDIINYLKNDELTDELFSMARETRKRVFGDKIFLYGFVYFSTWCRNNCSFCYYRSDNKIERYRKSKEEVLDIADRLVDSGVNLIDLTMGEDPEYHEDDFETAVSIVREIKKQGVPVMVSPGVVEKKVIDRFAEAGADFFALYQETYNRELFKKLRINQDFDERMECKKYAKQKGLLIEDGILVGISESEEDIAEALLQMGNVGVSQVRAMSFVPQEGTPLSELKTPGRNLEYKIIALLRLLYPKALIPASLDVDGISGLEKRIEAGANVVTSIIPPKTGLMGVAQGTMDVDEGGRTFKEAVAILEKMGLTAANKEEYKDYIGGLK